MPPSYRKPRGERQREMNTRHLFTLDSLPKDSSSPEENSFDSLCFQPRKADRGLPGIQIPAAACSLSIRLACRPVAAFVVVQCPGATQNANESGLPCPAESICVMPMIPSLPSQRPSPKVAWGSRPIRHRLSTCSPLPHYGVSITSLTATHRVPTGDRSGSCVSQHLYFESSVGELVSQHGNCVSRWGRQALLLDASPATLSVNRACGFRVRI